MGCCGRDHKRVRYLTELAIMTTLHTPDTIFLHTFLCVPAASTVNKLLNEHCISSSPCIQKWFQGP